MKTDKSQSQQKVAPKLSPRTLWGQLVVYLREHKNIMLHIVCGDITDVDVVDDTFIVKSEQQYVVDVLTQQENYEFLKNAFEYIGFNKFEIKKSDKVLSNEDNIKMLKTYFEGKVNIIDK